MMLKVLEGSSFHCNRIKGQNRNRDWDRSRSEISMGIDQRWGSDSLRSFLVEEVPIRVRYRKLHGWLYNQLTSSDRIVVISYFTVGDFKTDFLWNHDSINCSTFPRSKRFPHMIILKIPFSINFSLIFCIVSTHLNTSVKRFCFSFFRWY